MPIPVMSTEEARRVLARLVDPDRPSSGASEQGEIKEAAIRFGSILARLFGPDLDRMTLWGRIDTAIEAACAKVDDGDLDRFVHLCLDHVKAEASAAASCDALTEMLETFSVRPIEWRQGFVRWCRSRRYPLITHARRRWELVKKGGAEL